MTYNEARDTYGSLSKEARSRVLDRVSELTNSQIGPEAEAAFVKAVEEETGTYMMGCEWGGA